jgi:hypothetical protein
VTDIVFGRAIIGSETASQFLVRADDQTKASRGSAGKNAHFRATRLLGSQWKAGTENQNECRNTQPPKFVMASSCGSVASIDQCRLIVSHVLAFGEPLLDHAHH